jgi:hypothetical protein
MVEEPTDRKPDGDGHIVPLRATQGRKGGVMLSPSARAQIKAEVDRLELAYKNCRDEGIRKVIEGWIEEQKEKLVSGENSK